MERLFFIMTLYKIFIKQTKYFQIFKSYVFSFTYYAIDLF